ncbi:hypothetical protein I7I48_05168 [Histoplasma ohiense]|nr:hypothetical protein I7I48_05168 [Histoplasma ohiense (nom. inval.)]
MDHSKECKDIALFDWLSMLIFDFDGVNENGSNPVPTRITCSNNSSQFRCLLLGMIYMSLRNEETWHWASELLPCAGSFCYTVVATKVPQIEFCFIKIYIFFTFIISTFPVQSVEYLHCCNLFILYFLRLSCSFVSLSTLISLLPA